MKQFDYFIVVLIFLIALGGYAMGRNETRLPPAHYLPESMYDEIHAYRLCMQTPSCRMFVRTEK